MSVQIDQPGRSRDVSLNLVPFIDLLSGLLAFLLMTAVWTQVATLTASSPGGVGEGPPVPLLHVELRGTTVYVQDAMSVAVPVEDTQTLAAMLREQAGMRQAPAVVVHASDETRYESLVRVLDASAAAGLASTVE